MRWCSVKNRQFVTDFIGHVRKEHPGEYEFLLITDKEKVAASEIGEGRDLTMYPHL